MSMKREQIADMHAHDANLVAGATSARDLEGRIALMNEGRPTFVARLFFESVVASIDRGIYIPEYNFSVRRRNNEWCVFARQDEDRMAKTAEEIAIVRAAVEANKKNFMRSEG